MYNRQSRTQAVRRVRRGLPQARVHGQRAVARAERVQARGEEGEVLGLVVCDFGPVGEESGREERVRASEARDDVPCEVNPAPNRQLREVREREGRGRDARPLLDVGERVQHRHAALPALGFGRVDGVLHVERDARRGVGWGRRI